MPLSGQVNLFDVRPESLPVLVLLDGKTGKLITTEGQVPLQSSTFLEDFPYKTLYTQTITGSPLGDGVLSFARAQ